MHFLCVAFSYCCNFRQFCDAFAKLPKLERVPGCIDTCVELNQVTNLKELFIENRCTAVNMETLEALAKNLQKLERLTFSISYLHNILPFVQHSKRLKRIRLGVLRDYHDLDLIALNRERGALTDACQVSLCVNLPT